MPRLIPVERSGWSPPLPHAASLRMSAHILLTACAIAIAARVSPASAAGSSDASAAHVFVRAPSSDLAARSSEHASATVEVRIDPEAARRFRANPGALDLPLPDGQEVT